MTFEKDSAGPDWGTKGYLVRPLSKIMNQTLTTITGKHFSIEQELAYTDNEENKIIKKAIELMRKGNKYRDRASRSVDASIVNKYKNVILKEMKKHIIDAERMHQDDFYFRYVGKTKNETHSIEHIDCYYNKITQ